MGKLNEIKLDVSSKGNNRISKCMKVKQYLLFDKSQEIV